MKRLRPWLMKLVARVQAAYSRMRLFQRKALASETKHRRETGRLYGQLFVIPVSQLRNRDVP